MEDIHITKLEAGLLNAVQQYVTVQMAAVMGGHVHDDHRFFTLRFFNNRLWLYNGLRLNVRGRSGLRRRLNMNRLLRLMYRLRRLLLHRLLHGLLLNRLWRRRLLIDRLLRRLAHRFFHRLWRWLARLCRSIRRLILVLRRTRCFMLPMAYAGRSIDPMNTNFTHAVIVASIDVIFTVIVVTTGLHALQWAIAKHRGTLFTAGPETMYQ
ncbi:hypothetical protein R1TS_33280 [Enterobacter cloacae]|nr:hypothetical protein R1TS_33280 [Enterobacter cloacae]